MRSKQCIKQENRANKEKINKTKQTFEYLKDREEVLLR